MNYELSGWEEFWHCLKQVPVGQVHRCIPALWGEYPPGVTPPPPKKREREEGFPWKWVVLGLIVLWMLKK